MKAITCNRKTPIKYPKELVAKVYAKYLECKSAEVAGAEYGLSANTVRHLFSRDHYDTIPQLGRTTKEAKPVDLAEWERLCEEHKGFVINLAYSHSQTWGVDVDDLKQVGLLAIGRALEDYDPSTGFEFLTYAGGWIRSKMQEYCKANCSTIRIPGEKRGNVKVEYTLLDSPISGDGPTTIGDTIPEKQSEDYSELMAAVSHLTPLHRSIIERYFGLNGFDIMTSSEIAKEFKRNRTTIRKDMLRAIDSLKIIMQRDNDVVFDHLKSV